MEEWLVSLVGKKAILTINKKAGKRFELDAEIISIEDGFVNVRGCSGMIASIPIDDDYMKIEGVRVEF